MKARLKRQTIFFMVLLLNLSVSYLETGGAQSDSKAGRQGPAAEQSEALPGSMRGLWVVRYSLTSPGKIDTLLEMARKVGITDLFVQVRGRGDAYYDSQYEPKADKLDSPEFDPLGYLLSQTRAEPSENRVTAPHRTAPLTGSLRVHAWVNVFYVWSRDTLPNNGDHIVLRQKDWLARPVNEPDVVENYPNSVRQAGAEGLFISPLLPEAQNYFIDISLDILRNYPVDGLHLDYIRYPGRHFDLNPYIVQGYRRRFVIDPRQFLAFPDRFADKFGVSGYEVFYRQWQDYLRDGLSDFVRRFSQKIHRQYPDILISAAVKPDIAAAHWDYYQAWDQWVNNGWLDFAVPMNYTPDERVFRERNEFYSSSYPGKKIPVGIALYNQPPRQVILKIAEATAIGNGGFVLFSYRQLREQSAVQKYLINGLTR